MAEEFEAGGYPSDSLFVCTSKTALEHSEKRMPCISEQIPECIAKAVRETIEGVIFRGETTTI